MSDDTGATTRLEERPEVAALIKEMQDETAKNAEVTKEMVAAGLLKAAEMAQLQGDSTGMVAAWRELGKLLGFYAPEVKKIEKGINKGDLRKALADLSDEELLKLAHGRTVEGTVTGREVARLPDLSQKPA